MSFERSVSTSHNFRGEIFSLLYALTQVEKHFVTLPHHGILNALVNSLRTDSFEFFIASILIHYLTCPDQVFVSTNFTSFDKEALLL